MSKRDGIFVGLVMAALLTGACGKSGLDAKDDAGGGDGAGGTLSPPAECALPFDSGPCEAAIRVFAFVNGQCVERVYGGCEGNGNRFSSLEACLDTCEGRPTF